MGRPSCPVSGIQFLQTVVVRMESRQQAMALVLHQKEPLLLPHQRSKAQPGHLQYLLRLDPRHQQDLYHKHGYPAEALVCHAIYQQVLQVPDGQAIPQPPKEHEPLCLGQLFLFLIPALSPLLWRQELVYQESRQALVRL